MPWYSLYNNPLLLYPTVIIIQFSFFLDMLLKGRGCTSNIAWRYSYDATSLKISSWLRPSSWTKDVFFYFHKYFFIKKPKKLIKRLNDIIGHDLLWFINAQYLNIYCIYKLYRILLATKTDFYLFLKKYTKTLKILK